MDVKQNDSRCNINYPILRAVTVSFSVCVLCVLLCLTDSIVTPIMGSPVAGLHGQVLESDSDEFSPVMRKEKARVRHMERKKRKGKIEVSFNMGKLVSSAVSKCRERRKCWRCLIVLIIQLLFFN